MPSVTKRHQFITSSTSDPPWHTPLPNLVPWYSPFSSPPDLQSNQTLKAPRSQGDGDRVLDQAVDDELLAKHFQVLSQRPCCHSCVHGRLPEEARWPDGSMFKGRMPARQLSHKSHSMRPASCGLATELELFLSVRERHSRQVFEAMIRLGISFSSPSWHGQALPRGPGRERHHV